MEAVILYDSFFGNTEKIANAIGESLRPAYSVKSFRPKDASYEEIRKADLLVVGSPTRGFRPTEELKLFLVSLPAQSLAGKKVAAFDTRMAVREVNNLILTVMVKIFGYAAEPIAHMLKKCGGQLVVSPEGFFVKASEGPLKDGELERAARWGRTLLTK
jgi:flavodoxin